MTDAGAPALRSRCSAAARSAREVARLLHDHADDLAARIGAPLELVGIAVRDTSARARRRRRPGACSPRTPRRSSRARRRRRRRGHGRDRAGARRCCSRRMEHGASVVTANKALLAEDGATLHAAARRAGVDLYFEAAGRRRDPAAAPAARVAGRRPGQPRAGHRQRHHQLHPRPDGRDRRRASPTRSPRPQALGYAEADPTADVEGHRRGGEGRDPRRHSPSTPGSPSTTSTARASPRSPPPTSQPPVRWAASSSCSPIAERRRATARRRRPGAPGDDPAHPPAGRRCARPSTPCSSRRTPPAS